MVYFVLFKPRKGRIMNKEELLTEVAKKTKLTKKDADKVLSALIDTIQMTVKKGDKVTLVGFGTWERRQRAARTGRNPQTGKELKIAAKKVPAFSAGKKFKELLAK
jgi:DNA-binding protein HU-beta